MLLMNRPFCCLRVHVWGRRLRETVHIPAGGGPWGADGTSETDRKGSGAEAGRVRQIGGGSGAEAGRVGRIGREGGAEAGRKRPHQAERCRHPSLEARREAVVLVGGIASGWVVWNRGVLSSAAGDDGRALWKRLRMSCRVAQAAIKIRADLHGSQGQVQARRTVTMYAKCVMSMADWQEQLWPMPLRSRKVSSVSAWGVDWISRPRSHDAAADGLDACQLPIWPEGRPRHARPPSPRGQEESGRDSVHNRHRANSSVPVPMYLDLTLE